MLEKLNIYPLESIPYLTHLVTILYYITGPVSTALSNCRKPFRG